MSPVKSPEELSSPDARKQDKIVAEKDEAEELLPPGWRKEVKRRKTVSGSATKVDRYYTDPVTGYVFRSLKDAQRYIKTGELGRLAIKPKMTEKEEPSELKEQMDETLRQKQEPTDKPALASKRLAGIDIDAVLLPPSPPQTKTRQATRLAGLAVDAPSLPEAKTRQATRPAEGAVDAQPVPKTHQNSQPAEVAVDTSSSPPDTRTNQQTTRQTRSKIDASISSLSPAAPKTRQAVRQAGIKIDSPPPDSKTRQAKRVSGSSNNASPASQQQPKTRRVTRQAGIKINSPPPSPPDSRTNRQATRTRLVKSATPKENDKKIEAEKIADRHNQIADLNANPNHNQENLISMAPLYQESNEKQEPHEEHDKKPPHEDQPPPPVVIPPMSLEKHELPTVSNPIPQASDSYGNDMKPDSSINFSMNDLWTDPCIEFAVKTLTGAIPVTDLNKVENLTAPLQVPLEEIWTDPCIEFAVKTLTGAIPVGEDDHMPHRSASSINPQGLHQFSSHDVSMNFCQTDVVSKHYETGHKNKQQDSVFPTLGNGGKFVNGQSSRSRFFQ
ncbi:hypothetical protein E3N88_22472 [Mikania micrantha]|uniref:MBD domain-containing protein n=1 Tax=Mikania micrantha TaxID=192012 RepID=A0A5N6NAJ8_9ASTR|nr:hypothetical protein E3N88_22472 [Mikania micrantha]